MMGKLIIVCGSDLAGKTSVINDVLVPKTGATVMKFSKPDRDPTEYFHPAIDRVLAGENIICDRHLIGERVYAKLKGTPSQWREGEYEKMLQELNDMKATIIHVWEYRGTLDKRFDDRGETFVTKDENWKAQNLFKREFKRIAKLYPNILFLSWKPTSNLIRLIK